ncbi:hypothetical protein PMAYCL1PPCAC_05269 [Pristionchus mayeri]|uniref:Secreted protein n=1 Tax=Pristionchus mayeri TaxID=1317129 RepID=A0AAN5CAP4_9BILA|nr:hypothetical protein PMAYCL1PPCAC_05269 [Pristionchus mayeri]
MLVTLAVSSLLLVTVSTSDPEVAPTLAPDQSEIFLHPSFPPSCFYWRCVNSIVTRLVPCLCSVFYPPPPPPSANKSDEIKYEMVNADDSSRDERDNRPIRSLKFYHPVFPRCCLQWRCWNFHEEKIPCSCYRWFCEHDGIEEERQSDEEEEVITNKRPDGHNEHRWKRDDGYSRLSTKEIWLAQLPSRLPLWTPWTIS